MEPDFWRKKWEVKEIGFHQPEANAFLVDEFARLALADGARIFVPLCGKSLDVGWLLGRGYRVVGAELSEIAVRELFEELGVTPEVETLGPLIRYRAGELEVYVGDIFDLTKDALGPVDAIYDRAALVALPPEIRSRYAAHLFDATDGAPQFLLCFEYDQSVMSGPPFSIDGAEVARLYADRYKAERGRNRAVEGGLKGVCPADEVLWLLR